MKTKRKLFLAVALSMLLSLCHVGLASGCDDCPPPTPPPPPEGSITVHKFFDVDGDGVQGEGEMDIEGWLIRFYKVVDGHPQLYSDGLTSPDGTVTLENLPLSHMIWYKVWEEARECWEPTTEVKGYDGGYYVLRKVYPENPYATVEFGNTYTCGPGTGTPGYWKNHPDAWPVDVITIGGVTYTKAEAIGHMETSVKGDKTFTMFPALVAANLNVFVGNASDCIDDFISAADAWMASYGPVGSGVEGRSDAWKQGESLYEELDAYNNGELCAPSRDVLE
jgi:hypothetical protein